MLPIACKPRVAIGRIAPCHVSIPILGSHLKFKQNISINMSARKNDGVETVRSDKTIMRLSANLLRWMAAMMPSSTPTAAPNSVPPTASVSVLGKRFASSSTTGLPEKIDVPKSPCSALPTKRKYWIYSGSFRPRRSRSYSLVSFGISMPSIMSTGSPGISRTIMNTISDKMNNMGITCRIRLTMYFPTGHPPCYYTT